MSEEILKALNDAKQEMIRESQARLPVEERAWLITETQCAAKDNEGGLTGKGFDCTRAVHSDGDHIAHGLFGIVARWK